LILLLRPAASPLFPYTTLFRSSRSPVSGCRASSVTTRSPPPVVTVAASTPSWTRKRAKRLARRCYWCGASAGRSDGEQVACAGVGARVAQLRHRTRLDLADALPRQVEVLADLFERPRLSAVETEAQGENLALALVERRQQL